jgi:hypothetical protein
LFGRRWNGRNLLFIERCYGRGLLFGIGGSVEYGYYSRERKKLAMGRVYYSSEDVMEHVYYLREKNHWNRFTTSKMHAMENINISKINMQWRNVCILNKMI